MTFTEGSIGGDIERIDLDAARRLLWRAPTRPLAATRRRARAARLERHRHRTGEHRDGHALLLINPHTSFFFRSELQMTSDEGLNAYGASTWGQFFIYQGFNEQSGWMHTSSGVDAVDEFAETIVRRGGRLSYRYGRALRPVDAHDRACAYRQSDGGMADRTFTTYATHHGPIVRAEGGRWIALALMNRPIPALEQSWLRTKARDFAGYMQVAALQANSSNDTIYADATATSPISIRNSCRSATTVSTIKTRSTAATRPPTGTACTTLDARRRSANPRGHWLYNSNDAPWRAAGADSPLRTSFPALHGRSRLESARRPCHRAARPRRSA